MRKCYITFFSLFLTLVYTNSFAQTNRMLYVKVLMTDCPSCYGGFIPLDKLANDIPITLVFPTMEKKRVEHFIKNRMQTIKTAFPYIASDSLYNALHHKGKASEVIFKQNNVEIKRWELSKFDGNIPFNEAQVLMSLPDSVILNRVDIGFTDNSIILTDYTYNSIYIINKANYKLENVISGEKLDPLPAMRKLAPASVELYKSSIQGLIVTNTDLLRISGKQKVGKNALLSATLFVLNDRYDSISSTEHIEVGGQSGVIRDIEHDKVTFLPVEGIPDSFYYWGNSLCIIGDTRLITDINSYGKLNYFLAEFDIKDDKVQFNRFFPFIEECYRETFGVNVGTYRIIAYPYVMTGWGNELWNMETNELKYLPLSHEKFGYDTIAKKLDRSYTIVDATLLSDTELRILLEIGNGYVVKDVDLQSMTFIREHTIATPEKSQSQMYFYDKDSLVYVADEKLLMLTI